MFAYHLLFVIITLFSSLTIRTTLATSPPSFTVHPIQNLSIIDPVVACNQLNITIPRILAHLTNEPLTITNAISQVYAEGVNPSTTTFFNSIPPNILQPAANIAGAIKSIGEWTKADVISDFGYGEEDTVQTEKGGLPAFCRFGASITTSSISGVWFEAWMPLPSNATEATSNTTTSTSIHSSSSSTSIHSSSSSSSHSSSTSSLLSSSSSSTGQSSITPAPNMKRRMKRSSHKKITHHRKSTHKKSTHKPTSTKKKTSRRKSTAKSTIHKSTSKKSSAKTTSHKSTTTSSKATSSSKTTSHTSSSTSSAPTSAGGIVTGRAPRTRWRGRVVFVGNSGQSGGVNYPEMKQVLTRYHEVAVSTNAGHFGAASLSNWTIGNPESQLDFGQRGIHVATIASQQVVKAFYGIQDRTGSDGKTKFGFNTYFKGCSTGGREAFVEAQKYPTDYDGILAGSPALYYNDLNAYQIHVNYLQSNMSSPGYIPTTLYPLIHEQIIDQCDLNDGVMDAVIQDPSKCKPNLEQLLCPDSTSTIVTMTSTLTTATATSTDYPLLDLPPTSNNSSTSTNTNSSTNSTTVTNTTADCLTQPQLDNLAQIYTALTYPNGDLIHEPVLYGSEFSWTVTDGVVGTPFPPAPGWFQYQVLNLTTSVSSFDPYTVVEGNFSLIQLGNRNNPGQTNTYNGDLTLFFARGSKLIHYHGLADQLIPSGASDRFYNSISQSTKLSKSSSLSDFYRYFHIPGMAHCRGGDGAYNFGGASQTSNAGSRPLLYDSDHDALLALFSWTETGNAPSYIIGAAYKNNPNESPSNIGNTTDQRPYSNGLKFSHKMCPFPQQAVLTNSSAPYESSSLTCK